MKAIRLDPKDKMRGAKCQAGCGRTLRAGQVVLRHTVGGLSWDKEDVGAHVACVRRVLNAGPEEWDEFDEIKARLAVGGPLFDSETVTS